VVRGALSPAPHPDAIVATSSSPIATTRLSVIVLPDGPERENLPATRILLQGDDPHAVRRNPEFAVNAANYSRGPATARQWPLDGVLAIAAFGGTVALEAHGLGRTGSASHTLDPIGVVLAACTSLPLICGVGRRWPCS
jgi:hypothetical protein